jgi:tetratricopeptide (TPR) repeat protein
VIGVIPLGRAYCDVGRALDCRRAAERALNLNSQFHTGQTEHTLACELQASGDATGAAEHFQKAYELDPQNVTYRMDYEKTETH